jgi:uncharacterized protein (UPF0248 family)
MKELMFEEVLENISMKRNHGNVYVDEAIIPVKRIYRIQITTRGNVDFVHFVNEDFIPYRINDSQF